MLQVKTPEEVLRLIHDKFRPVSELAESVPLTAAAGRTLSEDIIAEEYVPDFNRSTVDGYAVRAADTFGCSDAIPAILSLQGEIRMGEDAGFALLRENCAYVPTGGALPEGADCAVMLEYTEDYGDGTIGILKPGAPGMNVIFRGDDVYPGKIVLQAGRVLSAQDIGALAAIGRTVVPVQRKLKIGVISTGDELVPPGQKPLPGQVRDVNTALLSALLTEQGAEVHSYGIIVDDEDLLRETVTRAVQECDAVLLSGGSSVGVKDASCRIIESLGELLLHGIALKPGKPTIMGRAGNKPLVGLPGHPVAAFVVARLFMVPLLDRLAGRERPLWSVTAELSESVGANHGRAQVNPCRLLRQDGRVLALPIRSKSGLITQLAGADGFFCIERDCEGLPKGAPVQVYLNA
ncbi:MAG: molybdopterin molybdotransferase MoeA [Oscillospiraceae bacterium]|nr:molybdopterin molybdotransferase MoeA [Oscillospiraceae bacterium]